MVHNVMTDAVVVDESRIKGKSINEQIAERQKALDEIDRAKFGWYHVRYSSQAPPEFRSDINRAIMVAGCGFFTDAYDIFSINMGIFPPFILSYDPLMDTSQHNAWLCLLPQCGL
jgi:hypothetical protein